MSSRRAAALLLVAAGCGFNPSGDGGGGDDAPPGDAPADVTVTLRDDAVGDFAVAGTTLESLVIEPWGALAPAAYYAGALLAYGSNTQRFTEADEASWTAVAAQPPAGTGFMTGPLSGDPRGVGITSGDSWTYWAEGEIWLDAGPTTFYVDADDQGFIDVAAPGSAEYTRVVNGRFGVATGMYTAAAAGWHPIRLAAQEGFGGSRFDIQLFPDGATEGEPLSPARLRVRVDHLRGTVLAGWDNSQLVGTPVRTLATADLVDASFGGGAPQDLGIASGDTWSLRWSGQFYANVAGTYQFRIQTDDGHRVYANGEMLGDTLVGLTADRTVDVALVAGWNDLVLDLNEVTGNASARLQVTGGPEPGLAAELPAARLRPLEPRTERLETAGNGTDASIPDNNPVGISSEVTIAGRPGATVAGVDVMVTINHSRFADLDIGLVHPGGNEIVLRDNVDDGMNGNRTLRFTAAAFLDTPAAGAWYVRVIDTASGQNGTLTDVQLAVHLANGPDQIARSAAFTSLVRDLGDVRAIDQVRFGGHSPSPDGIAVRLRTCDAPEQCTGAAWSPPITDGAGGAPAVDVKRYLQYRVELTSDGEREPELDWIEIDYRVPPT